MTQAKHSFQPRKIHIYAKKLFDAFVRKDYKNMVRYAELWAEAKAFLELEKNNFIPLPDE